MGKGIVRWIGLLRAPSSLSLNVSRDGALTIPVQWIHKLPRDTYEILPRNSQFLECAPRAAAVGVDMTPG